MGNKREKNQKNSKNIFIVIIIIVVIIAGIITAMSILKKSENEYLDNAGTNIIAEEKKLNTEKTENKVGKIEEGKVLVYEKDSNEISINYDPENPEEKFETIQRFPFINLNSVQVKSLNIELEEFFEKAKNSVKMSSDGYGCELLYMDYQDFIIDNEIISLVIDSGEIYVPGHGSTEQKVYNIDIETGKIMSNEELLEKIDLTSNELWELIEKTLNKQYEEDLKEHEADPMISSEIIEIYKTPDELLKAAKQYYEADKMYLTDENTLLIELRYQNAETNFTWTEIKLK